MNLPEMQYLRNRITGQTKCAGHINFTEDETYEIVLGFPPEGELWEGEVAPPKPKLSGKALTDFVRGLFKLLPFQQRVELLTPVLPHFEVLAKDDVVSRADYDSFKDLLVAALSGKVTEETVTGTISATEQFILNYEELV